MDAAVAAVAADERRVWEERKAAARAERARLAAIPAVPVDGIRGSRLVMLRDGIWQRLVRVNDKTVTVEKFGLETRHKHADVIGVR